MSGARADEFSQLLVLGEPCVHTTQLQVKAASHVNVRFMASGFGLFLPKVVVQKYQCEGAYLLTPGWLASWPERIERWGFNQATAKAFFAESCARLVLLDSGTDARGSAQLPAFASFVNRPSETVPVGLEMLRLRLAQYWRDWPQTPSASAGVPAGMQSTADHAMIFDLMSRLVGFASEADLVHGFFELFEMICAPAGLAYLAFQDGKTGEMVVSPGTTITSAEFVERLSGLPSDCAWLAERDGFVVRLQRDREMLGALLVDRVALPRRKADYLNLALTILPVLVLAVTNVRNLERLAHSEAVLRESEARYRALFESSRDAIMILEPPSWRFTSCNPAAAVMFRALDAHNFTAHAPWTLSPERQPDGRPSEEKARDMIDMAMTEGSAFFEWTTRLGGQDVPSTVLLNRVELDGKTFLQATVRDVSEQVRAAEEQRRMHQILEGILSAIPVRVFWKDRNLAYLGCNQAFARDAGFADPKDIVGKEDFEMAWRDQAELYRADDRIVIASGRPRLLIEEPQTTPAGGTIWLLTSKVPFLDSEGGTLGVLGTYLDITERKQAEAERLELGEQLRQKQKLAAVGMLACGVGHEINNPIMGIINYAQLVADRLKGKDDALEEFAGEIVIEAERVAGIIRGLTAFASRDFAPRVPTAISDLIKAAVTATCDTLTRNEITLDVDLPDSLPMITCDRAQMKQVVTSLIDNARDALNERYPGLDPNKTIRITARTASDCEDSRSPTFRNPRTTIRLTVEDRGTGIPLDVIEHIFEPFYTTKDRSVGAGNIGKGLGLFVSYAVVQEHGGDVSVESEVGQWARFHVDLPTADCGMSQTGVDNARKSK